MKTDPATLREIANAIHRLAQVGRVNPTPSDIANAIKDEPYPAPTLVGRYLRDAQAELNGHLQHGGLMLVAYHDRVAEVAHKRPFEIIGLDLDRPVIGEIEAYTAYEAFREAVKRFGSDNVARAQAKQF